MHTIRKNSSRSGDTAASNHFKTKNTGPTIFRAGEEQKHGQDEFKKRIEQTKKIFAKKIMLDLMNILESKEDKHSDFWEKALNYLLQVDEFYTLYNELPGGEKNGVWMLNELLNKGREKRRQKEIEDLVSGLHGECGEEFLKGKEAYVFRWTDCTVVLGHIIERLPKHVADKIFFMRSLPRQEDTAPENSPKVKAAPVPPATSTAAVEELKIKAPPPKKKARTSAQKIARKKKKKEKKRKKQLDQSSSAGTAFAEGPLEVKNEAPQKEKPRQKITPKKSTSTAKMASPNPSVKNRAAPVAPLNTDPLQKNKEEIQPLQERAPAPVLKAQTTLVQEIKKEVKSKYTPQEVARRKMLKKTRRLGNSLAENPFGRENAEQKLLHTSVVPQHMPPQPSRAKVTDASQETNNLELLEEKQQEPAPFITDLEAKKFSYVLEPVVDCFYFLSIQNQRLVDLHCKALLKIDVAREYLTLIKESYIFMRKTALRLTYGNHQLILSPLSAETLQKTIVYNSRMHAILGAMLDNDALTTSYRILNHKNLVSLEQIVEQSSVIFAWSGGPWHAAFPAQYAQPVLPVESEQTPVPVSAPIPSYLPGSLSHCSMWKPRVSASGFKFIPATKLYRSVC